MEFITFNRSSYIHGRKSEIPVSAIVSIIVFLTAALPLNGVDTDSGGSERLAWVWTKPEQGGLDFLASQSKRDANGYWVHKGNRFVVSSNISAALTAEAGRYAEKMLSIFPRVLGFPLIEEKQQFILTIHNTAADFKAAAGDSAAGSSFHRITGPNGSTAEVHICADSTDTVEKGCLLMNAVNLRTLQYESVRALLKLAARGREVSVFVSEGCAAFAESWDMREESSRKKTRMAFNARQDRLKALQDAVIEDGQYCPDLLDASTQLEDSFFNKNNSQLNMALAESFADFMLCSQQRSRLLPTMLYGSSDISAYFATLKSLLSIEQEWHDHICRIVSEMIYVQNIEIPVSGVPAGIPAASRPDRWGTFPSVSICPGPGDTYDIAWFLAATKSIRVLKCDKDNNKTGEISPSFLDGTGGLLGFCSIPGKNLYIAGHSKDNEFGNGNAEFWVAGFNGAGEEVFDTRIFGEMNSDEVHSKGYAGSAGTSRIIYNESAGNVGVYCGHSMKWPDGVRHQGGYLSLITLSGKNQPVNGWYVSHNFDQRMVVKDSDYYLMAHGDAFPRALVVSKWNSGGKHLWGVNYHEIPGESGDNTTGCQIGGLVVLDNKEVILVYASLNERKAHDVCVVAFDVNGKETGRKWLTSYEPGVNGYYPRIALYGKDVLVAWEESSSRGAYMQYVVIDDSLKTVKKQTPVLGVHVSTCYDMVNLSGGGVAWTVPGGGDKIRVYRIDLPERQYSTLSDKLKVETAKLAKTSYVPVKGVVEKMDDVLLKKLVKLDKEGTLPKKGMVLTKSKASVTLAGAAEDGSLKFEAQSGGAKKSAAFSFKELDVSDKAVIAAAVTSQEPENKPLCAVTAFYMQCAGQKSQARMYFAFAGPAEAKKFRSFFREKE